MSLLRLGCAAVVLLTVLAPASVAAHPMDTQNAAFVQGVDGPAPGPFVYLGRSTW